MVLAVMTEPQFQRLMKDIGRADALADPRFPDWPTRIQNDKALHEIIEAELVKETSATWAERFAKADVPAGRVLVDPRDRCSSTTSTGARSCRRSRREHGPDQGRGLGLPPGAWRRLGRPPAGDARPAHRRDPARGGLLGRRHRRHAPTRSPDASRTCSAGRLHGRSSTKSSTSTTYRYASRVARSAPAPCSCRRPTAASCATRRHQPALARALDHRRPLQRRDLDRHRRAGCRAPLPFKLRGIPYGVAEAEAFPVDQRAEAVPVQHTPDEWNDLAAIFGRMPRMPMAPWRRGPSPSPSPSRTTAADVIRRMLDTIGATFTYHAPRERGPSRRAETLRSKSGTCRATPG